MPYYLHAVVVDWRYEALRPEQQPAARRWAARHELLPSNHGTESFARLLSNAGREIGAPLDGAAVGVDDDVRWYGRFDGEQAQVLPEAACDEAQRERLRSILDGKIPSPPLTLADYDAARVDLPEQPAFLPEPALRELRDEAARLDASLSRVMREAWRHAGPTLTALRPDDPPPTPPEGLAGVPKRLQTFLLPYAMWREVAETAARLDRSRSWVLLKAWRLARPAIAAASSLPR